MNNIKLENWLEELKKDLGEGYFIAEINNQGCYFYYDYKRLSFRFIFTSNKLKVEQIKSLFEKNGRKITALNPHKDKNMILGMFNSYVESNSRYEVNKEKRVYKVEEHQIEHVFNQSINLEKSGLLQNFDINELQASRQYKYDQKQKETRKRKTKLTQ